MVSVEHPTHVGKDASTTHDDPSKYVAVHCVSLSSSECLFGCEVHFGDAPHSYLRSSECLSRSLDESGGGLTIVPLTTEM